MTRISIVLITLALNLVLVPAPTWAGELQVKEITASSVLRDKEKGITYGPEQMLDQHSSTMWVEGEGSAGLGTYLSVKFDGEVELKKIRIWAGCFLDKEFWGRHNRIKAVEIKFPDFTNSGRLELEDKMEPQWLVLPEVKRVSSLKIYIRDFYKGSTWNDTPITAIQFFDSKGQEGPVEGLSASASSVYTDDYGSYDAQKAVDGWLDTYWIEGGASGVGEFLDLKLKSQQTLKRFGISVGNGETESFFRGANRASSVTLRFSDGSTQSFKLSDKPELQVFEMAQVTTSTIRLTIDKVIQGSSNNDLYVGEVRFWN
ncbi:MAG TPA: hypothetical protein DIU15_06010 [Deltaproteobacteria bacterium]|nr:hypothetical protein [Deltaproteobacteria bacterium]HCP45574.1 hypothetical protein [Deltaproteobacteria bacterium]|tara:strand:+ start:2796 stop:3740 length:945 start_codon:yes stop_codon:yes gene_type:complete